MSTGGAFVLLAGLIGVAVVVLGLMSLLFARVTGWRALARQFPARTAFEGPFVFVNGVILGAWGWNAPPLWAGTDEVGIRLQPVAPFVLAFRPVHLPWAAIRGVERREYLFFSSLELRYGEAAGARIGFASSRLVTAIERRLGDGAIVDSLRAAKNGGD
jgi:hypothetical protein